MHARDYDPRAPKKATNVSVNSDLLRQARQLNINLSQTLEQRLAEVVREEARRQWLRENKQALDDFNDRIERTGVFSDGLRRF
jgi:antitoxin CcdA